MRTTAALACTTIMLGLSVAAVAELSDVPSGKYGVDPKHAYISFTYDHKGYSTPHIGFDAFDLTLTLDSDNPENSVIDVTIDASSVTSRVPVFDGHLMGPNFFDTENYPSITFKSTSIVSTGESTYDVLGQLTIKGMSKPVTLAAVINKADLHPQSKKPLIGISADAKVNRSDWDLTRAIPSVGDEVTIYISAELPQKTSD